MSDTIESLRARLAEVERERDEARAQLESVAERWRPGLYDPVRPDIHRLVSKQRDETRRERDVEVAKSAAMRAQLSKPLYCDFGVLSEEEVLANQAALASDAGAALLERLRGLENQVALERDCRRPCRVGRIAMTVAKLREQLASIPGPLDAELDDERDEVCASVVTKYSDMCFSAWTNTLDWGEARNSTEFKQAQAIAGLLNHVGVLLDVVDSPEVKKIRDNHELISQMRQGGCDCRLCAALAKLEARL